MDTTSHGKGDSPRSCFSATYRSNYDAIFRKHARGRKGKGYAPPPSAALTSDHADFESEKLHLTTPSGETLHFRYHGVTLRQVTGESEVRTFHVKGIEFGDERDAHQPGAESTEVDLYRKRVAD